MSNFNTSNKYEYIVLDSVAASGGDADLDAGILTIGNSTVGRLSIPYKKIKNPGGWKKQIKVAETAEVYTLTPTATNSTEYSVTIIQDVDGRGSAKTFQFTIESDGSATATEICDSLRDVIDAHPQVKVTTSGTTTLILTADTGYALFTAKASSNISVANTTPGVTAKNTGALLITAGYEEATSGNDYTTYTITYEENHAHAIPGTHSDDYKTVVVLINEGDGDAAALITELDNNGTADDGAGVADADTVAVA